MTDAEDDALGEYLERREADEAAAVGGWHRDGCLCAECADEPDEHPGWRVGE